MLLLLSKLMVASSVMCHTKRDFNKVMAEITGNKVNRGAGYGLELLCKYHLYGPKLYTDKLQEIILSLHCKCPI